MRFMDRPPGGGRGWIVPPARGGHNSPPAGPWAALLGGAGFPPTALAFSTRRTNSARWPPGSGPTAGLAHVATLSKSASPRYSESRRTIPNAAAAAANRRSVDASFASPVAARTELTSDALSVSGCLYRIRTVSHSPVLAASVSSVFVWYLSGSTSPVGAFSPAGTTSYRAVQVCPLPMSPASFASSRKSSAAQHPVLVPDQPVGRHLRRVELDLQLHVLGDRDQGPALLDEHFPGLVERVDVGVVAVAVVGELLQLGVLQVAHPEPEDRQVHARLPLLLDQPDQLGVVRHADVEVAVGRQDDAVDPVLDERPHGLVVGGLDSRPRRWWTRRPTAR